MAASVMASLALKPSASPLLERSKLRGKGTMARPSLIIVAKKAKKIQTSQPYGPAGGVVFKEGVDASGRVAKGKGLYQFSNKYGANVDGYSPIYTPEEWSSTGDVYVGGKAGLLLWAITLAGILVGGAILVYNTTSVMASCALKPSPSPFLEQTRIRAIQPSSRPSLFRVMAKKAKKIQTSQPFGPGGGLNLKDGVDASGRPIKGKGVYQFASKYGANVDGYRKDRVVALGSHSFWNSAGWCSSCLQY
uniref:Photosystem II 10 kDa polypeptide, chloroplastic n=1 Tax=Oryza meridionalis TaxID=40149 RepID=A0A0E0E7C8_9ORYZ